MRYIWQYVIYIGKSYRTNIKPIYCIIVFPETIMRHLILVQPREAYEYNHMIVSMEALGNILALADDYNSSECAKIWHAPAAKKHHVFSSPRQKYVTRPLGCAHIFQCGFEYVLVIFSQKYSLSDRVILGVVGQPNFFVVKKSTLNGGRLLIISWQPMVDEIGTLACTYLK